MKRLLFAASVLLISMSVSAYTPISTGSSNYSQTSSDLEVQNRLLREQLGVVMAENQALRTGQSISAPALQSTDQESLNGLETQLAKEQAEYKRLADQNVLLQSQVNTLTKQKTAPPSQSFDAENKALKSQIASLQSENTRLKNRPATPSFEAENRALKSQVATLQSELTAQRSKPVPQSFEAENKVLKGQLTKSQADLAALKAQSQNTSTTAQSSAKALSDVQLQNTALRNEIAGLQSALKREQDKILVNPYQAENSAMKRELEQTKAMLASAQAKQAKTPTADQDNQRGLELYGFGDYDSAFPYFRRAADQDHPGALTNLAMMYLNGYGVEPSLRQTEALLRRASALGSAVASENLAKIYQNGLGVGYNPAKAIQWYQVAARQGSTTAREQLRLLGAKEGV